MSLALGFSGVLFGEATSLYIIYVFDLLWMDDVDNLRVSAMNDKDSDPMFSAKTRTVEISFQ